MRSVVVSLLLTLRDSLHTRTALQLEILALRHQLYVVNRSRPQRRRLTNADRVLWVWLSKLWEGWRDVIVIVKPETVLLGTADVSGSSGPGRADADWVDRARRQMSAN